MRSHYNRLEPCVPKPQAFPEFEAAVTAVSARLPSHWNTGQKRVEAFYHVFHTAAAVPSVASALGLKDYFENKS